MYYARLWPCNENKPTSRSQRKIAANPSMIGIYTVLNFIKRQRWFSQKSPKYANTSSSPASCHWRVAESDCATLWYFTWFTSLTKYHYWQQLFFFFLWSSTWDALSLQWGINYCCALPMYFQFLCSWHVLAYVPCSVANFSPQPRDSGNSWTVSWDDFYRYVSTLNVLGNSGHKCTLLYRNNDQKFTVTGFLNGELIQYAVPELILHIYNPDILINVSPMISSTSLTTVESYLLFLIQHFDSPVKSKVTCFLLKTHRCRKS